MPLRFTSSYYLPSYITDACRDLEGFLCGKLQSHLGPWSAEEIHHSWPAPSGLVAVFEPQKAITGAKTKMRETEAKSKERGMHSI